MTLQNDADSSSNDAGTRERFDTSVAHEGSRPVRYELIDKDGNKHGPLYTIEQCRTYAAFYFPGQEQDEDRAGKGWDVQVVGS